MIEASGTALGFGLAIASGCLNLYQGYKSKNSATAATALDLTRNEMEVYQKRCERLQTENSEQKVRIAQLEAATDLRSLQADIANLAAKSNEMHAMTVAALNNQNKLIGDQSKLIGELFTQQSEDSQLMRKTLSDLSDTMKNSRNDFAHGRK